MPPQPHPHTIHDRGAKAQRDDHARQRPQPALLQHLQEPGVPAVPRRGPQMAEQGRDDVPVEVVQVPGPPEDAQLRAIRFGRRVNGPVVVRGKRKRRKGSGE
jgi:hypothetical protein